MCEENETTQKLHARLAQVQAELEQTRRAALKWYEELKKLTGKEPKPAVKGEDEDPFGQLPQNTMSYLMQSSPSPYSTTAPPTTVLDDVVFPLQAMKYANVEFMDGPHQGQVHAMPYDMLAKGEIAVPVGPQDYGNVASYDVTGLTTEFTVSAHYIIQPHPYKYAFQALLKDVTG